MARASKLLLEKCFYFNKFHTYPSYLWDASIIQRRSIYTLDPSHPDESTFNKILIANRGEIACRVIKTAKRMGIKTVAVYSVTDSQAMHTKLADESIFIGASPASESYLVKEKIMEAVKQTGAEAVHPGYGFLSENSSFVELLESENVTFIGPSVTSITGMGDKLESKRLSASAGVNIIPGFDGIVADADHCIEIAKNIGYPVMIKASAGGGGKGMRIVRNDSEVRDGFKLSVEEAMSSFGDSRMIVEKYIDNPRHIEIQVLGDKYGNIIYLNERECSIQRRNQKVIEEAPSMFLDEATRKAMGEQAVSLCKTLGYYSAGTVEFLVDENRNFYFLEMNTRLQVEHPITECITGVDLVQQMIRVAKGHKLNLNQEDIKINNWAIESRVYAEDPSKHFGLPSVGRLYKYTEPNDLPGVRCDSGVEEGSEISVYYDPMICKLVCFGKDRQEAIQRSINALDSYVIRGVQHNIPLLRDILIEERFNKGDINTNYLPQVYPEGFKGLQLTDIQKLKLLALTSAYFASNELRSRNFLNAPKHSIKGSTLETWNLYVEFNGEKTNIEVKQSNGQFNILVNMDQFVVEKEDINLSKPILKVRVNGVVEVFQPLSKCASGEYQIIYNGNIYKLNVLSQRTSHYLHLMPAKSKYDASKQIRAPMPGVVKTVNCKVGDEVVEGQEVCVIEAMKMQNSITVATSGKIKTININSGNTVGDDDILIELV